MNKISYKIIVDYYESKEYSYLLSQEDDEILIVSQGKRCDDIKDQVLPNILFGIPIKKFNAFCEILFAFKKHVLKHCFVGDNRASDYFVSQHVDSKNNLHMLYDISKVEC